MDDNIVSWRRRILSKEVPFLSPVATAAANFLTKEVRNEQGTWGAYKGFPMDLHASSLTVQALSTCDFKNFYSVIDNALIVLTPYIQSSCQSFGVQELVDSLNLLSVVVSQSPDQEELSLSLITQLKSLKHGFGWGSPKPSVTATAEVLMAFQSKGKDSQAQQVAETLYEFQRADDGGWPITPNEESSMYSSALMLQLLTESTGKRAGRIRSACVTYFKKQLEGVGWQTFAEPNRDIFTAAVVLRAISRTRDFPYALIMKGVEFFTSEVNPDGGWGEAKDGISNVELTSLSLLALCAAGENRFVPSVLAISALEIASQSVERLNREKKQLADDIDSQVKKEINNVIAQRDKYQRQVQQLESEKRSQTDQLAEALTRVSQMETVLSNLQSGAELTRPDAIAKDNQVERVESRIKLITAVERIMSVLEPSIVYAVLASLLLLPVFLQDFIVKRFSWMRLPLNGLAIAGVLLFSFSILRGVWSLRKRNEESRALRYLYEFGDHSPSLMVEQIQLIMTEWPPSQREDFLFRLSRSPDLPQTDVGDYVQYLSRQYSDSELQRRRLGSWISAFLQLPRSARRELTDFLRLGSWQPRRK